MIDLHGWRGVQLAWEPVTPHWDDLAAVEHAYAASMVPVRRAEFAAGRRAARSALAALGLPASAIPRDDRRAPVWPAGIVGSISHGDGRAGAIVARTADARGLGLDLERIDRLGDDIGARICTAAEWEMLRHLPPAERQQRIALAFAAKECVHKAWSPETGITLPFEAVSIHPLDAARFAVHAHDVRLRAPALEPYEGRWAVTDGRLVAALMRRAS